MIYLEFKRVLKIYSRHLKGSENISNLVIKMYLESNFNRISGIREKFLQEISIETMLAHGTLTKRIDNKKML